VKQVQVKLGHRYSQISTDIWFFVAFNILVIRVPKKGNPYTLNLASLRNWNDGIMGTSVSTCISIKDGEHKNEMPAVPV
jgi:hypothetical protein